MLTGSCSWTDKTLVEDADWYPRRTMSAEERLRYYAAQFPLTEIDSTYYAPPAERQVALWAERTPEGFRFDVKAYSLLTGHPTRPAVALARPARGPRPPRWRRSATSTPSTSAPRPWTRPGGGSRPRCGRCTRRASSARCCSSTRPGSAPGATTASEIEALRERLPDYRISVEFRSPRWLAEERDRERTLRHARGPSVWCSCRVDAPAGVGAPPADGGDQPRAVHGALPRALGQHVERHVAVGGGALSLPVLRGRSSRSSSRRSPSTPPRRARPTC